MLRDCVVLFRACVDDKVLFVRGCLPALIVPGGGLAFGMVQRREARFARICRAPGVSAFEGYGMYDLVENEEDEDLIIYYMGYTMGRVRPDFGSSKTKASCF